jgi:hypothetical protein
MCNSTFRKITIAAISPVFLRLMMRLAVYAEIKNPGLVKTAANAVEPGAREEIPDSKSNYLVNQLRGYGHEF